MMGWTLRLAPPIFVSPSSGMVTAIRMTTPGVEDFFLLKVSPAFRILGGYIYLQNLARLLGRRRADFSHRALERHRMIPSLVTSLFGPYEFLVRRLHSLTGLLPIGGYMIIHLATNASLLDGASTFQARVDQIHSIGPSTLLFVEWSFIFLPILFHGLVGLAIVLRGKRNTGNYPYIGNFRYTLQRFTGVVAMLFILFHVFHLHGWFRWDWWVANVAGPLGGARFDPHNAATTLASAVQASTLMIVIYAIGVTACVYHLANGLWTMGITWGLWTTPRSQRWANWPCLALGLALLLVGWSALYSAATLRQAPSMQHTTRESHPTPAGASGRAALTSASAADTAPASSSAPLAGGI